MALNIVSLNARKLRDASKCARLLAELSNLCVDVAAVQETHFTCEMDCWALEDDFVVFSASGSHWSTGVSLLVGYSLDAIVNLVFAGDSGQLVVADFAMKTFEFWIALVYVPNTALERHSFFQRLGSFLDALKVTIQVGDWNAILDVKGRLIQNNLYLVRQILEGIENDTEAALINLDQSKALNRMDHQFLVMVLDTAKFEPEFCKWISMMYHNPQANGRHSRAFAIERSVRQA